ncbi:MAG: hypothetical protein GC182_02545 [Rhodopseudomonas sp.]|nr:hypothetical protein [Rhodopseudomonas sp.]
MKIFLADLCYLHDWDNNQPVPLNVGYIAAYLKQQRPDDEVELFKDPRELLDRLAGKAPDILAMSNYDWNSNLNVPVLAQAKKINPGIVTIMGGPNFQANDRTWMDDFFTNRPELDAYITGEGEFSFAKLVGEIDEYGAVDKIPLEQRSSSVYAFDHATRTVLNNPLSPVARLDLSTVPSPYLNGMMDKFLRDPRLAPIIETNRGCPYSCTYCCWGQALQSKVNRFPLDVVQEELRYAARVSQNPLGFFYVADGNFGIYERDFDIAKVMQECTETYGAPKRVFIYFAKNTNERVLKIAETLRSVTSMSMSKQTLNATALENVKRKNIPIAQYDLLRHECEKRGIPTFCELIWGLAGESDESFIDGVIATIRDGQRVTMYPQLLIAGAESNDPDYRRKFGLKTAFRIIPRYVSSYGDIHSLEYEEIVVAHNEMTREGFWRIRLFQFLVTILSNSAFQEFNKSLTRAGLDYGTLAKFILNDRSRWTPGVTKLLDGYLQAARDELIEKEDIKVRFTADDIAKVNTHQLALIPYFLATLVSDRNIVAGLHQYLSDTVTTGFDGLADAAAVAELRICLEVAFDKLICYEPLLPLKSVSYDYDFDAWLGGDADDPLELYQTTQPVRSDYQIDKTIVEALEQARKTTATLAEAVYRVRTNRIGPLGERVFCYVRMTKDAGDRERQLSVNRAHADMAVRL